MRANTALARGNNEGQLGSHWGLGESSAYVIVRYPSRHKCKLAIVHLAIPSFCQHLQTRGFMPSLPLLSCSRRSE